MAPNVKDVTFEVVSQNDDGTYTVRPSSGGGSPYAGGGSSPNLPAVTGSGYIAMINGRRVSFASEADAEVAGVAINELRSGRAGGARELVDGSRSDARQDSGSGARFLRGGADAADTITAFFRGRNLRQKREDLKDALAARDVALNTLGGLQSKYPDLVSALTAYAAAESDVNAAAIGILDDQILGVDVQAGTGVARVVADLWDGMGRRGMGGMGGGDGFSALAVGGLGVGVGMLLASRSPSSRDKG